jgi:hypothetical protein
VRYNGERACLEVYALDAAALVDEHPWCDAHGHELLEEQLASVRYEHLADVRLVAAATALRGQGWTTTSGVQQAVARRVAC